MKKNLIIKHISKIFIVVILLSILCSCTEEQWLSCTGASGYRYGCAEFMLDCVGYAKMCANSTNEPTTTPPANEIDKTSRPGDYQSKPDEQPQKQIEVPKEPTTEQQGGASGAAGGYY